jgi:diguanylate cyclase (GGDEF)-like protein
MRARFAREPTALVLFDLDQFKGINDRYGHHVGDEVLTAFCKVATTHLRRSDLFSRIGGEEFASLLPDTGLEDAVRLADRTRAAVEATSYLVGEHSIHATVSVGVAFSNDATADLTGLLKAADEALYRAKQAGRNRVVTSPFVAEHVPLRRRGDDVSIHKRTAA